MNNGCAEEDEKLATQSMLDLISSTENRNNGRFAPKRKKPARDQFSRGLSVIIPAASYSPTQLPAQYHRLQEA